MTANDVIQFGEWVGALDAIYITYEILMWRWEKKEKNRK